MHIPDGFLDSKTWVVAAALSVGGLAYSIKKSREDLEERMVPKLGIMAAFIFAAQMINFPVAPGTSGHLLGAALATILLGPWNASLVIATVLFIQCLGFQDGGITALGANILNMAVVGVLVSYLIYCVLNRLFKSRAGRNAAIFLAAWTSVQATSLMAAMELLISGSVDNIPAGMLFSAVVGWHALIGIGEGLLTVVVVNFVERAGFQEKNNVEEAK